MRWPKLAYPRPKQPILASFIGAMVDRVNWIRHVSGDGSVSLQVIDGTLQARFMGIIPPASAGDTSFPAVITGNAAMTGHTARFWYAWTEITAWTAILPSSGTAGTYSTTGGIAGTAIATPSGSDLGGAFNVWEYTHVANPGSTTAWYVGGVQANSSNTTTDYPSTFGVRPVGGGGAATTHRMNVLVRMYPFDFAGTTRYGFFGPSITHDGECP